MNASAEAEVKTKARLLVLRKSNFDRVMTSDPAMANKTPLVSIRTVSERPLQTSAQAAGLHT
jgi:hypothetical protein